MSDLIPTPETFHISHPGNAGNDRGENDRRDHHSNQPDETIAQRLQVSAREIEFGSEEEKPHRRFFRRQITNQYPQQHSDQDPKIELLIIPFGGGNHEGLPQRSTECGP